MCRCETQRCAVIVLVKDVIVVVKDVLIVLVVVKDVDDAVICLMMHKSNQVTQI